MHSEAIYIMMLIIKSQDMNLPVDIPNNTTSLTRALYGPKNPVTGLPKSSLLFPPIKCLIFQEEKCTSDGAKYSTPSPLFRVEDIAGPVCISMQACN